MQRLFAKLTAVQQLLRSFLPLPCPTTLKKLLNRLSMDTGVTMKARARLKMFADSTTTEKEKAVFLMWDELLLGLGLHYDPVIDKIVGFEDWGNVRTDKFADHGLVFMLRFIDSGNIIPISFNFCDRQTTTQLLYSIKEVVAAIKDAVLNLVATVCDGGSSIQAAIKI